MKKNKQYGFTLIEVLIVVAIMGILAAIAIPAMTKFLRRAKTSEARVQIAKLFDATSAFFNEEHADRGNVALIGSGGTISPLAPHRCPHGEDPTIGLGGPTPDISLDCNTGPGGRCVPGVGGMYEMSLWTNDRVWNSLNFQMEQAHYFHYGYRAANSNIGYGDCQFTAQAFADLDDDDVFSTYERAGAADINGVNGAAGLYIDSEVE
jgi:type IV pilus assembly protein PilA